MRRSFLRPLTAALLACTFATSSVAIAQTPPAPGPSPSAAPAYGDLTHLTFTATTDLHASLVSPKSGSVSDSDAPIFEVATGPGGGVEVKVNDEVVPFSRIGKRVIYNKTGETHYFYYGVDLVEGDNQVVLTPLGADGLRGTPARYSLTGPGAPAHLEIAVNGNLKADGRTPALLHVIALDRLGHHARPNSTLKIVIASGDAKLQPILRKKGDASSPDPGDEPVDDPGATPAPAAVATSSSAIAAAAAAATVPVAPVPAGTGLEAGAFSIGGSAAAAGNSGAQPGGDSRGFNSVADTNAQLSNLDIQLAIGGVATLRLIPGLTPGDVRIRASYGELAADRAVFIAPNLRKPMVVGLATAGLGSIPGVPGEPVDSPNGVNARRGRIALYGIGAISQIAQATFAYDTGDTLQQTLGSGAFAIDPNSRPYSTYGDSSSRRDDALSRDHLYARVDAGRSSAMWGEFQADTGGANGIGGFSQLVAGAKVEVAGQNAKVVGFQARNDIAYARQLFAPSGLATIGTLLHTDIVIGSETITLVALDRRTGAILSQTVLARNIDYTLDYTSGYLHFLDPPLPFDPYFNPQQLLVQYEYGGPGANAETTGGRASATFGGGNALHANIGYVNDSTGSGNFSLLSEDVGGVLSGGSWTVGHLSTNGSVMNDPLTPVAQLGLAGGTHGDAYRAALTSSLGVAHLDAAFETTSQGFDNPFGGLTTPGLLDYRVALTRRLGDRGDISVAFDHQQNNVTGSNYAQSDGSVRANIPVGKRLTLRAGVDVRTNTAYTGGNPLVANSTASQPINPVPTPAPAPSAAVAYSSGAGTTVQGELGFAYKLSKSITLQADRISNFGAANTSSQPSQTTAELDADFAKKGRVFVRQLWSDAGSQSFASATTGLTGTANARSSTELGVERSLGANTTVDSEYVIDRTDSGSDAYAEMGVREKLAISKNLRGEASLQRATAFGGDTSTGASGFNIYGLSLAYAIARFHASAQYQLRTGYTGGYTFDVAASGALSPDVSAFVSTNTSSAAGFDTVDSKATIAFRPSGNDRSVTLASFEASDGNVSDLGTHAQVLSVEELFRPSRDLEIAGRYAYKLDGDSYYPAQTSLIGLRVDQRLTRRFDVAGEARWLSAHNIPNASVTGFALEAGYRLGDEMRLAAGYNFTGAPDPSLIDAPTRRGAYATVTSVIDRIFGWGLERP
jgi:hypothetical protein